jgi:hypothetical protein
MPKVSPSPEVPPAARHNGLQSQSKQRGRDEADRDQKELEVARLQPVDPPMHPAAAAAGEGAATVGAKRPNAPALAVLLSAHILRDGEVVLLIIKPSLWFIVFASLTFTAAMAVFAMAATLWLPPNVAWYYVEAALFVVIGRVMWATLQWINRLYILTDLRVLRLSGVFTIDIFDCPLRRIAQTVIMVGARERLVRLGSIEIQPSDEQRAPGIWQNVRRPRQVNEMLQTAIAKAKSGGSGLAA